MPKIKTKRTKKRSPKQRFKASPLWLKASGVLIILAILSGIGYGIYWGFTVLLPGALGPGVTPPEYTTVTLYNINSNDNFEPGHIHINVYKTTTEFDDEFDDMTNAEKLAALYPSDIDNSDYWELEAGPKDAADIQLSLADFDGQIIIVIDPEQEFVYESNQILIDMGLYDDNKAFRIPVAQKPTNVVFSNTIDGNASGVCVDGTNRFQIEAYPNHDELTSWDGVHIGDNWEYTTTEFEDLTTTKQEWYLNEDHFCSNGLFYNSSLDSLDYTYNAKQYETLSLYISLPAIKITLNDTITADYGITIENCTSGIEILNNTVDSKYIYLVSTHTLFAGSVIEYDVVLTNRTVSALNFVDLKVPGYDKTDIEVLKTYSFSIT